MTDGYHLPARYVKVVSSSPIEKRQNASVPLNSSATARYVRQLPTLNGAASDVAFRYVLNLEVFCMDSRVPFSRLKHVVFLRSGVGEPTFPYPLPCTRLVRLPRWTAECDGSAMARTTQRNKSPG